MKRNSIILFVLCLPFLFSCEKENTVDPIQSKPTTLKLGTQVWMIRNLDVSIYRNGDSIPEVKDPVQWTKMTTGAWCYYNNDSSNGLISGKLYNWYAVNDPRGLAPIGWHVPSDTEWKVLESYLGMSVSELDKIDFRGTNEGGKLKETGTDHWWGPNSGATNESGFTALPGGYRYLNSTFYYVGAGCGWWSSTFENTTNTAWYRGLKYDYSSIIRIGFEKNNGFSVRCVKD